MSKEHRTSLTEDAYRFIKEQIVANQMAPGYQALERELADRLQMSRTPVREALIRLQEEGLVEVIPRRGFRVLPLLPDDMLEIYEVLTCVEAEAAYLLAKRRPTREELGGLEAAAADMEAALAGDDLEAWAEADDRFHRELVRICGNKRLAGLATTLSEQSHRARMFTLRLRSRPQRSTQDHREQINGILEGDAEAVRRTYRRHREQLAQELTDILKRFKLSHL